MNSEIAAKLNLFAFYGERNLYQIVKNDCRLKLDNFPSLSNLDPVYVLSLRGRKC